MRTVTAVLLVLASVCSLTAATMHLPTDADLTRRADVIVVATVTGASSRAAKPMVMTDYELVVEEVVKGRVAAGERLVVSEFGGYANGRGVLIPGRAAYAEGERVVAFLRVREDGSWFTAHMSAGKFRFEGDMVVREIADHDTEAEAIPANAFLPYLRELASGAEVDRPVGSVDFVRVAPKQTVHADAPDYVLSDGVPARPLRQPGCESSCNIGVWTNGTQPGVNASGVNSARNAWENEPNSAVNFTDNGTTTTSVAADDNVNVVLLGSNASPAGLCDGTDGCAVGYFGLTHTFKSVTFYSIEGFDLIIRPLTFSQNKFNGLVTHELGHILGFRHANAGTPSSTTAVMSLPFSASIGANLQQWDREAVATVYGNGLPCEAASITSTAGGGTVPYNGNANLSVVAGGTAPINYQWYEGTSGDASRPVGSNQATFRTPDLTETKRYWVKVQNACGNASSDTITVNVTPCNPPVINTQPASQRILPGATATLQVTHGGTPTFTYSWFQGAVGNTSQPVGANQSSFTTPQLQATTTYWVRIRNACGQVDSQLATITVAAGCVAPSITSHPANHTLVTGAATSPQLAVVAAGDAPFTYQWYEGTAPDTSKPIAGATSATHIVNGPFLRVETRRFWVRVNNACGTADSATASIDIQCGPAARPEISAPPTANFRHGYRVTWTGASELVSRFEVQESTNREFSNPRTFNVTGANTLEIPAHTEITADTRFYYRVRGIAACNGAEGEFSLPTSTVVLRPQPASSSSFSTSLPVGTQGVVTQDVFISGFVRAAKVASAADDTFLITADQPFITFNPASGILPAAGVTVQMITNLDGLPAGATQATITIERFDGVSPLVGGDRSLSGNTKVNVPVSISLVTPVTPSGRDENAPDNTLIIPSVGHVDGLNSRFQSDVRIANTFSEELEYLLTYTPTGANGIDTGKQTFLRIAPGETKGLNDIVKEWYGAGLAGEFGLGALEIRPQTPTGVDPALISRVTVASSRTYNTSDTGTFGQYIPALALTSFITDISKDPLARISLQQIAQSSQYRTNVGFVEGSGQPASVTASLFDASGTKIREASFTMQPFEQKQMPLTDATLFPGITLTEGRIEVHVTSETGKVNAFASVLDNRTSDPLLVFPVQPARLAANRFVLPGVAELDNGAANFHTDMRIYNAASTATNLTLEYFPRSGAAPTPVQMTLQAGEVRAVDNTLLTLWNISGSGGAVHVVPSTEAPVIVTGRTFSRDTSNGTYGQFIPAVSARDAIGEGERPLEVVQLEESALFRTNVGIVEVTGNPVAVKISVTGPDSRLTASTEAVLNPNEFRQLDRIFSGFGFSTMYNGRVSVQVIGGSGRVAAYGSIIDNRTQDPTYVPAQ